MCRSPDTWVWHTGHLLHDDIWQESTTRALQTQAERLKPARLIGALSGAICESQISMREDGDENTGGRFHLRGGTRDETLFLFRLHQLNTRYCCLHLPIELWGRDGGALFCCRRQPLKRTLCGFSVRRRFSATGWFRVETSCQHLSWFLKLKVHFLITIDVKIYKKTISSIILISKSNSAFFL